MSLAGMAESARFYHAWDQLQDPPWAAFYQQWWAEPGTERIRHAQETGFLTVDQLDVCQQLGVLADTGGRMYVHDEITRTYGRVSSMFDKEVTGVVCTGMPGCGKSAAILYVLLRRMAAGQAVIYSASTGQTFVFDDEGVWTIRTDRFVIRHPMYVERRARMWSLVDHSASHVGPPDNNLLRIGIVFPVHAVRVEEQRYSSWVARTYARHVHMNPGTSSDILECVRLHDAFRLLEPPVRQALEKEGAVDALIARSGPTPVDVLQEILHPGRAEDIARQALRAADVEVLAALRREAYIHHAPNELADLLLLWKRHNVPKPGLSDLVEAGYKSELAFRLLYERVCELKLPHPAAASVHDRPQLMLSGTVS